MQNKKVYFQISEDENYLTANLPSARSMTWEQALRLTIEKWKLLEKNSKKTLSVVGETCACCKKAKHCDRCVLMRIGGGDDTCRNTPFIEYYRAKTPKERKTAAHREVLFLQRVLKKVRNKK